MPLPPQMCEKGCLCFKVIIVYFWTRLNRNRVLRIQLNARQQTAVRMNIQTDEKPDSSGLFIAQPCIRGGPIPPWCMAPVSTPGGKSVQKLLQVLVMATSGVNMSQHRTTSNFLCAAEEARFLFFLPPFYKWGLNSTQVRSFIGLWKCFFFRILELPHENSRSSSKHVAIWWGKCIFSLINNLQRQWEP